MFQALVPLGSSLGQVPLHKLCSMGSGQRWPGHLPDDHTVLLHPKAGTWHRQPLKPPGAVVTPAVTQAAGQETSGVVCRV